jgi:hypothetical protein
MNEYYTRPITQEYEATHSNPYEGNPLDCLTVPDKYNFPVVKVKASEVLKDDITVGDNNYISMREDTKHIFAFVKQNHKVVLPVDVMAGMRTVIEESDLNLKGMTNRFSFRSEGAEMHCRIIFPNEIIEPRVGDTIRFGIELGTSLNAIIAFFHRAHADRLICLNGMVSPSNSYHTYHKHTSSLNLEKEAQKLYNGVEAFFESTGTYQRWMKTNVSNVEVNELFKTTLARKYVGGMPKVKKKDLKTLMIEWNKGGSTLWDTYNVSTAWATHLTGLNTRGGWKPATQRTRNGAVSSMLRSDMWKELEHA